MLSEEKKCWFHPLMLYSRVYFKFAPQVAWRYVLFVPVNWAGQMSAGQASPFTGTVFERYNKRSACHLESELEVHFTISCSHSTHSYTYLLLHNLPILSTRTMHCIFYTYSKPTQENYNIQLWIDIWATDYLCWGLASHNALKSTKKRKGQKMRIW